MTLQERIIELTDAYFNEVDWHKSNGPDWLTRISIDRYLEMIELRRSIEAPVEHTATATEISGRVWK